MSVKLKFHWLQQFHWKGLISCQRFVIHAGDTEGINWHNQTDFILSSEYPLQIQREKQHEILTDYILKTAFSRTDLTDQSFNLTVKHFLTSQKQLQHWWRINDPNINSGESWCLVLFWSECRWTDAAGETQQIRTTTQKWRNEFVCPGVAATERQGGMNNVTHCLMLEARPTAVTDLCNWQICRWILM